MILCKHEITKRRMAFKYLFALNIYTQTGFTVTFNTMTCKPLEPNRTRDEIAQACMYTYTKAYEQCLE